MQRILVPTDFSDNSRVAFSHAQQLAARYGADGAQIVLICVLEDLLPASVQFEFGLTLFDSKSLLDEAEKHARTRLLGYAKEFFPGVNCETNVLRGSKPTPVEIVEFADRENIASIVLATHGRTGIQRWTLGSVAENIVRRAHCPVLVIPTKHSS